MIQQPGVHLIYILKTGECFHGVYVPECPLTSFCKPLLKAILQSTNPYEYINLLKARKQEARKQYIMLYGEEALFDELL